MELCGSIILKEKMCCTEQGRKRLMRTPLVPPYCMQLEKKSYGGITARHAGSKRLGVVKGGNVFDYAHLVTPVQVQILLGLQ